MSKRNVFASGFPFLHDGARLPIYDPMGSPFNARLPQCDFVLNALGYNYGLDYSDHYEDLTDDDDDDDDDYSRQNNGYCGFAENFLDKRVSKQLSAIPHYKTVKRVTPEEAAKNAKELVAEEEKLKEKAEKKKKKKLRQRERRRLEKLEKENGNKDGAKQNAAAVPDKSQPSESENKEKTNNGVPPDPGPKCSSIASESSDSCNEDDGDDNESIIDELELDMSSCFVNNAAAIAKRKLEQKTKSDRKDKKAENVKIPGTTHKSTTEPLIKNVDEKASEEPVKDNVTKSMELAVIGNKYAQIGDLDTAVKFFTDAIKHNPQEVKLFGNRSFCYEKMQLYEKALIDADIALSLDPTWIKGLYRKGKALVGLKRYYEAGLTYKKVLKIDSSCTDAAQELMRVQIMQLMDMGYTREQSSNALIIHGTVEKALEALSGLHANIAGSRVHVEELSYSPERNPQPVKVPLRTIPQNPPKVSTAVPATAELFPIWVGDLVPALSETKLYELFSNFGTVHSVRLLSMKRCAFINYTNKEDCETAIKKMNGFCIAGTCLVVRYPDRIHTHLGVSKAATTDAGKVNKFPDECFFWRTTGCIKNNRCSYRHVPEHKGIDRPKVK
ncbi:uncharacterized protein si:dkey-33c12.4 isoform X2 [Silurus meridionalis]|uniref:Tetratricopeptide repeat protein 31 n=1 Tax=Silurus meridionalis TaxID=175797 RepID=A0A8T0BVU5_SILME|nr:uncharacterized protein si:dkey-33c12.4 isoform X2 [Silurus meridionalis]KAF7710563.1 hypothetical protein HF521_009435 [Silurus meridionalis]